MSDAVAPIFQLILTQSCKAVPVICALLLFHALLGRRLSPGARYALWLLVPVTLLFCLSIPSPLSVYNLLPVRETAPPETSLTQETPRQPVTLPAIPPTAEPQMIAENVAESFADEIEEDAPYVAAQEVPTVIPNATPLESAPKTAMETPVLAPVPTSVSAEISTSVPTPADRRGISPVGAAALVWLAGCVVMTLVFLRQGLVCRRWIRRGRQVTEPRVLAIFGECVRLMKVRTWLVVAESTAVSGPFLIGVLRPTLLLPEKMAHGATEEQLRTVFLHELAHLKRWDVWTGWLMTCLLIVHWFNPLLWLAVRRLNDVREEACDATALARLDHVQRKNYGLSLVDIAAQFQSPGRTPGLVGISEDGRILTRRIEMIRNTGTWKSRWALLAALFALLLGAVTMTDAQQPSKPGNIVVNGIEYAPVAQETQNVPENQRQKELNPMFETAAAPILEPKADEWQQPAMNEQVVKEKLDATMKYFAGTYDGSNGDGGIRMVVEKRTDGVFPITIYPDYRDAYRHLPDMEENAITKVKYVGTANINANTRSGLMWSMITLDKKFIGEIEEPVEEVLRTMKATILPGRDMSPDHITLIIPMNDEWDTVQMVKMPERRTMETYPLENISEGVAIAFLKPLFPIASFFPGRSKKFLLAYARQEDQDAIKELLGKLDQVKSDDPGKLSVKIYPIQDETDLLIMEKIPERASVSADSCLFGCFSKGGIHHLVVYGSEFVHVGVEEELKTRAEQKKQNVPENQTPPEMSTEAPEVPDGTYDSKEDGPRTSLVLIPIMPGRFKAVLARQAVDDPKWTSFSYEGIATQVGSTLKFEFLKKGNFNQNTDSEDAQYIESSEEKCPDDLKEVTVRHLCDEKNADVLQFPKTGEWDAFSLSLAEERFMTRELSGGYVGYEDDIPYVIELIPVYNARVMPPDREFVLTIRCHRVEDRQEGTAIRDGNKLTLTIEEKNKDGSKRIDSVTAVIRRDAVGRPVLDCTVEGEKEPVRAVKIKSNDEWKKIEQKWEELRKAQAK